MASKLRIVALGYVVRGPLGGLCWHHAQYALGLQDLGHEVLFVEHSGDSEYCCYHPLSGITDRDPSDGLEFTRKLFSQLNLAWAYFDRHADQWCGPDASRAADFCRTADIVINLSLANDLEHELDQAPVRIAVDTDPVFNQIRNLTVPDRLARTVSHNRFFSYGVGMPNPTAPRDSFDWKPTRQPVVMRLWPQTPPRHDGAFTTVMQWDSYATREWNGISYGQKSASFPPYMGLPKKTSKEFAIVVGSPSAPRDELRANGWQLLNPNETVLTPDAYRGFIQASKAEFSVAKHGYVAARSGWFGDRSTSYLASGRPVVIQDTGYSEELKQQGGIFTFESPEEAADQIERVCKDYVTHSERARTTAIDYFEATKVLREILDG